MEQKYLNWYRNNQELHDQIIQEKSNTSGSRGSLYWGNNSTKESDRKYSSGSANGQNEQVLTLKINQLEEKIKHLKDEIEEKEHEIEEKQHETRDTEDRLREVAKELSQYKDEFETEKTKLHEQFDAKKKELDTKIQRILAEEQEFKAAQERIAKDKIQEVVEKETKERDALKERIEVLEKELNDKDDQFLKQGVQMDEIKTKLTISQENEVKLQNDNDCQKEMIEAMQKILQKHEKDNQMLAEKLVAFKQQIIDSDKFKTENQKYEGLRYTSFGKGRATLYFIEENVGNNKTDTKFSLVLEYGSGKAFKISIAEMTDFYKIEGTNQIWFSWPDKSWLKKNRTETFETPYAEIIVEKYLRIIEEMEEIQERHTPA